MSNAKKRIENVDIIMLGAPGSGKGTQSDMLIRNFSFKHLSTGDLLRKEISNDSMLGREVKKILQDGQLVSDELVVKLIKINYNNSAGSYIFDGFPRTLEQAKSLTEEVLNFNKNFRAVYFQINVDLVVARLSSRRMCRSCGAIFNTITNPTSNPHGSCDKCDGELYQREDDKDETIRSRLDVYTKTIGTVLKYYKDLNQLVEIDASQDSDHVFKQICEKVNKSLE